MTDAQIKRMAKQLRAGADGYATLRKALSAAQVANPTPGGARAVENMGRLQLELDELAWKYENVSPESWIHGVRI